MPTAHLEYIGVTPRETEREYAMCLRSVTGGPYSFTLVIDNEAFLSQRARYQDGPDLCFQKMQREMAAREGSGTLPEKRLHLTDAEIDEYRVSHTPKPAQRKIRPAQVTDRL